jgi:pimeloyl-ACP methyl ester carboxylesterase
MTETGSVTVNGAQLTYDITGAGHPLVLLHGSLGDRRMWDNQMDAFARHYRVIRYDQHGYGEYPQMEQPEIFNRAVLDFLSTM